MATKEVQPLARVLGTRAGLIVRVYARPVVQPGGASDARRVLDEYYHGRTTGRYHGPRPVLEACPAPAASQPIDYYLSEGDVYFPRQPPEAQRARRVITRLPVDDRIEAEGVGPGAATGGRPRGFSNQQLAELAAQMHRQGYKSVSIEHELGLSRTTLYRYLRHYGFNRRRAPGAGRPAKSGGPRSGDPASGDPAHRSSLRI